VGVCVNAQDSSASKTEIKIHEADVIVYGDASGGVTCCVGVDLLGTFLGGEQLYRGKFGLCFENVLFGSLITMPRGDRTPSVSFVVVFNR
jgi:hypothetical protein